MSFSGFQNGQLLTLTANKCGQIRLCFPMSCKLVSGDSPQPRARLPDEDLGEIGKDAPVAIFVGIGQGAAGGGLADAGVVEFRAKGRQAGFDVAQTFAPRQLGEGQHEELFVSGEFADAAVAVVTGDTLVALVFGQEVEELGEDGATFVHQVENRRNAGSHPQEIVAKLKSKNGRTAVLSSFYNGETHVRKN